ncbi:MAG: hydratase [Pseudomonadota bacterium]
MRHEAFTDALIAAHASGVRFAPDMDLPSTNEDAYAVQSAVMPSLGAVGGFKVACKPGLVPIMAPIPATRVVLNGASEQARDRLGVELEIGAEIVSPIPPEADFSTVAQSIRLRPVLELVDYRIEDGPSRDPVVRLADMQGAYGLVLGDGWDDWDGTDITEVTAYLSCNGEAVFDGAASIPGGSVLRTVSVLANLVGDHCGGLRVGHVVITGSLNGLPWFPSGTAVTGRIDGVGEVHVTL